MASSITIKCLKTIIRNKNVLNIYMIIIFLSSTCYIRMHIIELFSFFEYYHFLENRIRQFRRWKCWNVAYLCWDGRQSRHKLIIKRIHHEKLKKGCNFCYGVKK